MKAGSGGRERRMGAEVRLRGEDLFVKMNGRFRNGPRAGTNACLGGGR